MANDITPQLTLHVNQHPHARELEHGGYLQAEITPDAIEIDRDMQPGDLIRVTITDADGTVIGQGEQEIGGIGFKPLKVERRTIGLVRAHKAKAVYES